MKKYFYSELPGSRPDAVAAFKEYLRKKDIYFEASGCFQNILFSILISPEEVAGINSMIDKLF